MISLGVDVGSTNLKVVLAEVGGDPPVRRIACAAAPTARRADALVADVLRLVATVLAESDRRPECVGVASMAETGVPLDAGDRPVGELVRWDRGRGGAAADALVARFGAADLFATTGVRPSAKAPLAVWASLAQDEPGRWAALRRWAGAADLVVLALTGRLVTDHTLAGRTMAFRLPEVGTPGGGFWDRELLAAVGLTPEQLPEVPQPGAALAGVAVPGRAGLPSGTPVLVAGHDHVVGAWAAGVRAAGDVADSVGTAEAVLRVLDERPEPEAVRAAGMSLGRTVTGDADVLVAGSASAGAMLGWWAEQEWARTSPTPVEELLAAAGRRRGPSAAIVLPYLRGRQAPHPDPAARVRVVGDLSGRDEVDRAGALLDGLSLQARWMLTEQAGLVGADPAAAAAVVLGRAAGDGSAWLARKAAVGPMRLRAVTETEAVATGAALLAAWRTGAAGEEAPVLPSRAVATAPDPAYEPVYAAFVAAAREPA